MTEQGPDSGPEGTQQYEYLGDEPAPRDPRPRRGKRAVVGLTVGALVVAGAAGAFAVAQFLSGGPQAASAAPADTMAWIQVDLDPSGGQKLAAYQTLKKFPALKAHLGLTSQDDLRSWLFRGITSDDHCTEVDFGDVDPWLGNAFGVGAVPGAKGEDPTVFATLEVTDQDKADRGIRSLGKCLGEDKVGTAFTGDFMIVAETDAEARSVADSAETSSLADDPTYSARTGEAGDDGVVTGYLAPAFGDFMAEQMKSMGGMMSGDGIVSGDESAAMMAGRAGALTEDTSDPPAAGSATPAPQNRQSQQAEPGTMPSDFPTDLPSDFPTELLTEMPSDFPSDFPSDLQRGDDFGGAMPMGPMMMGFGPGMLLGGLGGLGGFDQMADQLADFGGAAMQVRFADESLEVELSSHGLSGDLADSGTVDLGDLPSGTGLALGLATGEDWASQTIKQLRSAAPREFDKEMAQASKETGLSLPEDVSTMVGDSMVVALDSSVDFPKLFESFFFGDPSQGLKAGVRIAGDPSQIAPLVRKLADHATREDGPAVVVAEGKDAVAVGFDQAYVQQLADGGDLGGSDAYTQALPDDGDSIGAVFADFDANGWLDRAMKGSSKDDQANAAPLSALGITSSRDGDVLHATLRLTTD